jgi:hypothetical protein
MTAEPVEIRLFPHGGLPAHLLSFFHLEVHSLIILTGSAIIKIITTLEGNNSGLHPYAWIFGGRIFVRLYCPGLTSQHGVDPCTRNRPSPQVGRPITNVTSFALIPFIGHFSSPWLTVLDHFSYTSERAKKGPSMKIRPIYFITTCLYL